MFNFGQVNEVKAQSPVANLAANEIHDVTLKQIEKADGITAGMGGTSNCLDIEFANDNGSFRHRMFEWTAESGKEQEGQYGKNPARAAQDFTIIKQLGDALGVQMPVSFTDWNDFRNKVIATFTPVFGKELRIKLVSNNKGFSAIPGFPLAYNKNNELYTATTIFAAKDAYLDFTKKEKNRIEQIQNATPTPVQSGFNFGDGLTTPPTLNVQPTAPVIEAAPAANATPDVAPLNFNF